MATLPMRIILADDDESDRINFKEALDEIDIHVLIQTVNDGIELMSYLQDENNQLPDLLFLDLNMPKMNGKECLKEIRKNLRIKELPIAIYSTSSSEKEIEETFLEGANVYIKKPNNFEVLKQILGKIIQSVNVYKEPPFNKSNFILRV